MKFTTVDEYISSFPEETQKILEEIRETVRMIAPDAKEKISYQSDRSVRVERAEPDSFCGVEKAYIAVPDPSGE